MRVDFIMQHVRQSFPKFLESLRERAPEKVKSKRDRCDENKKEFWGTFVK